MTAKPAPTLHIGFCANDAYVPYLRVAVRSIALTFSPEARAVVHVFTDGIGSRGQAMLSRAAESPAGNVSLEIHTVDDSPLAGLKEGMYTRYAWYRLLIPGILTGVDRLLYLDTDVLVADDLSPLIGYDLGDKYLAVPPDTDSYTPEPYQRCGYDSAKGYFCSGVMLLNLRRWRDRDLPAQVMRWARDNAASLRYPDQDSINYVCRDSKGTLPLRYGVTKSVFTQPWFYTPLHAAELSDCLERPAVIHYAGCAPWLRESDHPQAGLWRRLNASLPHPAPLRCRSRGLLAWKIHLWDWLHPGRSRAAITPDQVRRRLALISDHTNQSNKQ